jgi:hypothetical protein
MFLAPSGKTVNRDFHRYNIRGRVCHVRTAGQVDHLTVEQTRDLGRVIDRGEERVVPATTAREGHAGLEHLVLRFGAVLGDHGRARGRTGHGDRKKQRQKNRH